MGQSLWKPPLPVTSPEQARTWSSLSQWLRVPWTHVFTLSFNGSTSSATISDMPSPTSTMQYLKARNETRMVFVVAGSSFGSAANAITDLYLSNTGVSNGYVSTDPGCGHMFHNAAASQHIPHMASLYLDGMPSGLYTMKLRWRQSGTGGLFINADLNDVYTISVTETNGNPDF